MPIFVFQRLWSNKSDVWSFGTLLWEIFSHCQDLPLTEQTDHQIIENLQHMFHADGYHLLPSPSSVATSPSAASSSHMTKEVLDLMHQCWSRAPDERPKFSEIHQFL